ncbi:uncharacterized protein [Antedon mediterranea]|uniref:uncharacterized protein n=1 Tax=Antedon mediterranea TaxID=105859 RepID=UPI003AF41AA3
MYTCSNLLVFIFLIFKTCVALQFLLEPVDTDAVENEEGFFFCIVRDLLDDQELGWFQGPVRLSNNTQVLVDNNRYNFDYDEDFGQYRLVINSVSRQDGMSTFSCRIIQNGVVVLQSREAKLRVSEIPNRLYPICLPLRSRYKVGDRVVVSCKSEVTTPAVSLTVSSADSAVGQSLQYDYSEHKYVYLRYSFSAQAKNNGDVFTCSMTSPSMKEVRTCNTSPLNVYFKPNVTIQGPKQIDYEREEIFICYSNSNPQAFRYHWRFEPPIHPNRYKTLDNILQLVESNQDLIGSVVVCVAENAIGNGTCEFMLNGAEESTAETHLLSTTSGRESIYFTEQPQIWWDSNRNNVLISLGAITVFLIAAFIPLCIIKCYTMERKNPSYYKTSMTDYTESANQLSQALPLSGQVATWNRSVGVQVRTTRGRGQSESPAHRYV